MAKRQNLQLTITIMLGNNLPKIHQEKMEYFWDMVQ